MCPVSLQVIVSMYLSLWYWFCTRLSVFVVAQFLYWYRFKYKFYCVGIDSVTG